MVVPNSITKSLISGIFSEPLDLHGRLFPERVQRVSQIDEIHSRPQVLFRTWLISFHLTPTVSSGPLFQMLRRRSVKEKSLPIRDR